MAELEIRDQLSFLNEKIDEAKALIQKIEQEFGEVEGARKLCNKIRAEIKLSLGARFQLQKKQADEIQRSLGTSNILHFTGIVQCALRYQNCTAFCKTFTSRDQKNSIKLEVDLVLNGGETWVKVISRSVRGLAMDHVSAGNSSTRSAVGQARCFNSLAAYYPHFYKCPNIIFEFMNGVPSLVADAISLYGIRVIGDVVPIEQIIALPDSSDSDSNYSAMSSSPSLSEFEELNEENNSFKDTSDTLNLDVTAVFAFISSLTHGNGANFEFTSPMLNDQARDERKDPVLPKLKRVMEGKKLIICRTAYDSVKNILSTVAGPMEKKRAEELFKNVTVVEDKISERTAALKLSDKINKRSKIIFGSGDYYKAVTLTANKHFVNAAIYQVCSAYSHLCSFILYETNVGRSLRGLHFAVIVHGSRALSEQKEELAKPAQENKTSNCLSE
uniref:UPF0415 protein C7orf25 homolog n=1 Tax=Syphacia muris TaxID=451379 RepID=A0A0N5AH91_9BILA